MENRIIRIPIDLTKTGGVIIPTENKVVYTSDTVSLSFALTGITDYTGVNTSLALTMADGSAFQHEKPITASPVVFNLQANEVLHAGMVAGQLKITDANGSVTSQEFIFSIKAFVLDAYETLEVIREIEVDSFETLKEQVEGIQAAVVANWDIVQANLDTMEAGYAADWSAWFTTNTNSITAEWITLKGEINAKQATFAQDIATVEADEAARVTAESGRATAEGIRTTSESGRGEEEASRVIAETGRVGAESTRVTNENTRKASEVTRVASESARNTAETTRVTSENTRVSSEATRVSQENARKTAETARVSVASADHTTAQGDHSTALTDHSTATADHSTAVTDHTTNLADHSTVQGYNGRLTTVESNTVLNATNLVTNGDFSNGTTGWASEVSTSTTSENTIVNTVNTDIMTYGRLRQPISGTRPSSGDKMYVRAKIKLNNTDCTGVTIFIRNATTAPLDSFPTIPTPKSNEWISYSAIKSASGNYTDGFNLYISQGYANTTIANGKIMEVQYVHLINLTATFGAGKEPTLAEMDRLMARYPNSWFDGTKSIQTIETLYQEKANKVQGAWITPTLLNGWTSTDFAYIRDEFGTAHFKGVLNNPTYNTAICTLATGYKPNKETKLIVGSIDATSAGGVVVQLLITTAGTIWLYSTATKPLYMNNVSFKLLQ